MFLKCYKMRKKRNVMIRWGAHYEQKEKLVLICLINLSTCQFNLDYHVLSHACHHIFMISYIRMQLLRGPCWLQIPKSPRAKQLTQIDGQRISLSICFPYRLRVPKCFFNFILILDFMMIFFNIPFLEISETVKIYVV